MPRRTWLISLSDVCKSLKDDDTEITLREVPHSSTYITTVPLDPMVRLVECVNKIDVSVGSIIICADWINVKLSISSDEIQIS